MPSDIHWRTLSGGGADAFERIMVPAVFDAWANDLLARAAPKPGEHLLDVACGTGVVARTAVPLVQPGGSVTGLDLNSAMLEQARRHAGDLPIEWVASSADAIPRPDADFDLLLCQQGLQYFPDRVAALGEMRRVTKPGGRLALSVFCDGEGHWAVAEAVERHLGKEAANEVVEPLKLPYRELIRRVVEQAGWRLSSLERVELKTRFKAAEDYVLYNVATRLKLALDQAGEAVREALVRDATAALEPFTSATGCQFTMVAHVVTARRG
jgi:ubiquinone/menaquinone biosynthesis C-methylase UbiE